jgi:uncharacterized membrane protein (Fun14 family)
VNRLFAAFLAQPRWKKLLLGISTLLVVGGGAASGVQRLSTDDDATTRPSGEVHLARRDRSNLPSSATPLGRDPDVQKTFSPTGSSDPARDTSTVSNHGSGTGTLRQKDESAVTEDATDEVLAPAALQGGFSFFAAFAAGYALRAFLKLSFVYVGLVFLTIFFLSWIGWLDVRWEVPQEQFASLTETLKRQFESFQAFIGGSLPSAGMAGLGLITGLKKK